MRSPSQGDLSHALNRALNRGNLRAALFRKEEGCAALERILHEALQIHQVDTNQEA